MEEGRQAAWHGLGRRLHSAPGTHQQMATTLIRKEELAGLRCFTDLIAGALVHLAADGVDLLWFGFWRAEQLDQNLYMLAPCVRLCVCVLYVIISAPVSLVIVI
jgi:hypothetical protein